MADLQSNSLDEALSLLGELLDLEKAPPVHLVVVGGAALLASGMVTRTTKDVDVIAEREIPEGMIVPIQSLSDSLREAVRRVATELDLPENWLNASTALFTIPLDSYPPEIWNDMETRDYGSRLQISFLGRTGLIFLKFYAAIEPRRKRRKDDRGDLKRLAPSKEETVRAIDWLREQQLLLQPRVPELIETLKFLGHDDLVSRVE